MRNPVIKILTLALLLFISACAMDVRSYAPMDLSDKVVSISPPSWVMSAAINDVLHQEGFKVHIKNRDIDIGYGKKTSRYELHTHFIPSSTFLCLLLFDTKHHFAISMVDLKDNTEVFNLYGFHCSRFISRTFRRLIKNKKECHYPLCRVYRYNQDTRVHTNIKRLMEQF